MVDAHQTGQSEVAQQAGDLGVAGVVRVPGSQEPGGDDVVHAWMHTQPSRALCPG